MRLKNINPKLFLGNYGNNIDGHNVHYRPEDGKDTTDTNEPSKTTSSAATKKGAVEGAADEPAEEDEDEDEEEVIDNPYSESKIFLPTPMVRQPIKLSLYLERKLWVI